MSQTSRFFSAVTITTLVVASCSTSPGESSTRAESAARQNRGKTLNAALSETMRDGQPPGIAAAIVFADGSTWSGSAGTSDTKHHRPVTNSTAFSIASISKTFVAAAALRLEEDGAVDLDEPIARWAPKVDGADHVTLRQLLRHTSGLGESRRAKGL